MRYHEELDPYIDPKAGSWTLLVGPSSLNTSLLQGIAHLLALGVQVQVAEHAGVRVLDGGNRFNAYTLARAARGRQEVLNRITVARAFTCYQVLTLLESTPASDGPFVILDLLRTFYDESVQAGERQRLLRACIAQMQRLEQASGGLVSVHPPAIPSPAAVALLGMLEQAATDTFFVRGPLGAAGLPDQLKLF
jgi:hypothetical protein